MKRKLDDSEQGSELKRSAIFRPLREKFKTRTKNKPKLTDRIYYTEQI